jgi:hypothetical protein
MLIPLASHYRGFVRYDVNDVSGDVGGASVVRELQPGDPQTIGPYRVVGQLGGGGMGRVYLGVSAGGRPVAVKVIRAELAADPEFRMRFGREVAAARRVSGLFTAMVVDADVTGPTAWLATAYVPGPSLFEAVNDHGPLPVRSLLTLAAGLAESLSAIHAAGVVHRDLKPSNVLLAEDGPRVIDFGISRAAESTVLTQAGLVIGSPGFISPEQAAGYEVGPPSDIFSLAAVLAFAATGQGPFGEGTTVALLYRVVHGSPSLDQVPAEVRPLIERCLAKDPRQRPSADGLLAEVGALQPATNWLPESIIRAFARDAGPGPAPAAAATPATPAGRLAAPGFAEDATQTTTAGAAAQVPGGESLLLAPAGDPQTATSKSMPSSPGNTPPPGGAYRQPPPGGRNQPRRRSRRPMVLAWIIGGVIVASAAGFAVTALTGHTPTPTPAPAGLTSSATASASGGRVAPAVSASPVASRSVPSSVSASASSSLGASPPASASPSPSVYTSRSPSASASPSRSPSASPSPSPSPSPSYSSPSPSVSPSPSISPSPSASPSTSPSAPASSSAPASTSASTAPSA